MQRVLLLIIVVFLLAFASPVLAQEPLTPTTPDQGDITMSLFEFFGVVVTAVLGGTLTVSGIFVVAIRALLKSTVLITILEHAYNKQPEEYRNPIRETISLLDEITDGVPLENKPSPSGSGGAVGQ